MPNLTVLLHLLLRHPVAVLPVYTAPLLDEHWGAM